MKPKRLITEPLRWTAHAALAPLEASLLSRAEQGDPPVFIVGAPRSGTSLLYELLVTRARFSYFSNLAHRLYRTPAAATRLGRAAIRRWSGELSSDYGHIPGWGAPNEGGWIWRRWITETHTLEADHADRIDAQALRRTVHAVAGALGAPFLNKNVMHSAHMGLLDAVFPGALFVHMRRDPVDNARSIYRARLDDGDPSEWISVKPRGWEAFARDQPLEQVASQVLLARRQIEDDGERLGAQRVIDVDYETLCARTSMTVDRVLDDLSERGVSIETRGQVPGRLDRSRGRAFDPELERRLVAAVDNVAARLDESRTVQPTSA